MRCPERQRGIALIMALLIVALATIVAVALIARSDAEFRRSELLLHGDQAMEYVLGAEQWVMQILRRDRAESGVDTFGEPWAVQLPPLPVDGGVVIGRLEDLNGKFNLANLRAEDGSVSQPHVKQFERLLAALGVADQLAVGAVVDWVDADSEVTAPGGAEDAMYLGMEPAHRAANRPPVVLSELVLLPDFDQALLPVLAPHVVALPARTTVNVNMATAPVLMSLAESVAASHADALVEAYRDEGYDSIQQFTEALGADVEPGIEVGLQSDWFRLTVTVTIGTTSLTMYSLLERSAQGPTRVVARQQTPW